MEPEGLRPLHFWPSLVVQLRVRRPRARDLSVLTSRSCTDCNLVGRHCHDWFGQFDGRGIHRGWHHPGSLCTTIHDMRVAFGLVLSVRGRHPWSCRRMCVDDGRPYPGEPDTKHSMNEHVCVGLCRTIILVFGKAPPSAPPTCEPHPP